VPILRLGDPLAPVDEKPRLVPEAYFALGVATREEWDNVRALQQTHDHQGRAAAHPLGHSYVGQ
jgi:hypothetical protein